MKNASPFILSYSGDTAFTGTDISAFNLVGVQAVITGNPTGTLELQVSNDVVDDPEQVSNWFSVGNSSTAISALGGVYWNNQHLAGRWVRVLFTGTGTGLCYITVALKGSR